jgi:molybdopterin-biosynthesis enzyme MoeA-like protein
MTEITTDIPPTIPNRYNTATLVMMVGGAFVILDPFMTAAGSWIQAHSSIVFSPGYSAELKHWVEVAVTAWVAHKHTAPATAEPVG